MTTNNKHLSLNALLILILAICQINLTAQAALIQQTFPEKFYFEKQIMVSTTNSILELSNVQSGKMYSVYMYDERAKDKRVCEYSYGQNEKRTDQFVKVKAERGLLKIEIERYNCKFESSVLVTAIIHCLDCDANENIARDPDVNPTCDIKLLERDDYGALVDSLVLSNPC